MSANAPEFEPRPAEAPAPPVAADPSTPVADPAVAEAATAEPFIGPRGHPRRGLESSVVRIIATCGIIGIAVALAAILGTQDISAWVIGLVVSTLSVVLAAILWSSRTL